MSASSCDSLHTGHTSTGTLVAGFADAATGGASGDGGFGAPLMRPSILRGVKATFRRVVSLLLLAAASACAAATPRPDPVAPDTRSGITAPAAQEARSAHGVVASATVWATEVGATVLAEGGNAVDAAVATAFALAVTEPSMSGLGGRASLIIRTPDGELHGIDGLNQVPRAYKANSGLPPGYERAATPGMPAALARALADHGTWPLARVLAPAIRLAEDGVILSAAEAGRWAAAAPELEKYPASRGTYLQPDGSPWRAGTRVTHPLLARTLRTLATEGVESFYRGSIAAAIDADMRRQGGFILRDELSGYEALPAIPARGTYRGYQIASNFRPAAGHAVIQALQSMENLAVPGPHEPARWAAVIGQAMHYALADRGRRAGTEEDSAQLLTSLTHARDRAASIVIPTAGPAPATPQREVPLVPRSMPPGTLVTDASDREATTHLSVVDREGRLVALTQSLGPAMGTALVAPDLGFLYATRLGTAPGSRPASTVSPTIVMPPARAPAFALGGAGDARIISAVTQVISRIVDHRMSLAEAVAAPRVHPDEPRVLRVETGPTAAWTPADRARLEGWGFKLVDAPSGFFGRVHAVWMGTPSVGVAEPRWTGSTAGPIRR
jgi:gamma-glutamyltranspeptidase/glutathione hydrolase